MSAENDIQNKIEEAFGKQILDLKIPRELRMFVQVPSSQIKAVIKLLKKNFDMTHISTITAIDVGENIEILYHFFCHGVTLSLRTFFPKSDPVIDTITDIMPGATLYEREIQDLLGVKIKDHPDPRRLILPDDWEEGVYPLRKDYQVEVKEG